MNVSRPDIMYAMCRRGRYIASPTAASFSGLKRICRYLATKPHRPLFFPSQALSSKNIVVFQWSPKETEREEFNNELTDRSVKCN